MLPIKNKLPPLQKPLGNVVIDWSNPLTRGLVAAILVDGHIYHNIVNGDAQLAADPMSFGVRHDAVGGYMPRSGYSGVGFVFSYVGLGTLTLVETSHRLGSDIYKCGVCLAASVAHGSAGNQVFFRGGDVRIVDSSGAGDDFGTNTINSGKKSVRATGVTSGIPTDFYVDGVYKGSYAGALTGIDGLKSIAFGTGYGYSSHENIYESSFVYNRELTEAEHKSLAADPYQIFKPAVEQVYFTAAAAGGATQTITGSLFQNAQTFNTNEITSEYTITGSLFQNAQTFYANEITASYTITGSLFQNQQTFYANEITSEYTITGSLFENQQAFYQNEFIQIGALQTITGALFQNQQTFYANEITSEYTITGALFQNDQTFYTNVITQTPPDLTLQTITGSLFINEQTFYSSIFSGGYDGNPNGGGSNQISGRSKATPISGSGGKAGIKAHSTNLPISGNRGNS